MLSPCSRDRLHPPWPCSGAKRSKMNETSTVSKAHWVTTFGWHFTANEGKQLSHDMGGGAMQHMSPCLVFMDKHENCYFCLCVSVKHRMLLCVYALHLSGQSSVLYVG